MLFQTPLSGRIADFPVNLFLWYPLTESDCQYLPKTLNLVDPQELIKNDLMYVM